jgi:hypothetical protein
MGLVVAIAVLATLGFIAWIIVRAVRQHGVKAHFVSYGVAVIAGIFTYAYFLSLDFPQLIKILVSIIVGILLILVAALYQRRRASRS